MHDIIEHYGKTVVAMLGIVMALIIVGVIYTNVKTSSQNTAGKLDKQYEQQLKNNSITIPE